MAAREMTAILNTVGCHYNTVHIADGKHPRTTVNYISIRHLRVSSVLPNHPSTMCKIMLRTDKNSVIILGIVLVTCPNLLKMGIRMDTTKILGRTWSDWYLIDVDLRVWIQHCLQWFRHYWNPIVLWFTSQASYAVAIVRIFFREIDDVIIAPCCMESLNMF